MPHEDSEVHGLRPQYLLQGDNSDKDERLTVGLKVLNIGHAVGLGDDNPRRVD
jgi:hypothetical protein